MSDVDQDLDTQDDGRYERTARSQGWRPQDQFKGNPDDWVDARTFVQRGEEIRRYTKKEVDRLNAALEAQRKENIELRGTVEEVKKYHAEMEERAIQAAITRIKKDRREAAAAGNHELAADLDEQIEELEKAPRLAPKPAEKKDDAPKPGELSPEDQRIANEWNENNAWINDRANYEDEIDFAMGVIAGLAKRTDLTLAEKFEKLDQRVRKQFPNSFGDPEDRVEEEKPGTRQRKSVTAGGGEGGGSHGRQSSKNGVAALPADARAAGERFVKQGLYKDINEYAQEYWAQPGAKA